MSDPASSGLPDAARMADAAKRGLLRRPDERDTPPPRPFPGPKVKPLPGQLALGEEPDAEEPAA
jgi:hypothetical protein